MEDKGKELRKNALNEDELNDVAGGECYEHQIKPLY